MPKKHDHDRAQCRAAHLPADWLAAQELVHEYAASLAPHIATTEFAQEQGNMSAQYETIGAQIILAWVDGQAAGCCALRPLPDYDQANAAEMQRLFVRRAFRGLGLGRLLCEAVLDSARACGYHHVLLDTLDTMETARELYQDLGFYEILPFKHSSLAGAHYLRVDI